MMKWPFMADYNPRQHYFCIMRNLCSLSWDILLSHLPWSNQTAFGFPSSFFFPPFFLSMLESELKHSACSNWKMYSPRKHCLLVCLCVGLCLCMPVCRQWGTDAERCVLIFCTALGSSGSHVGLLWCHACVTGEYSAQKSPARDDQNGTFSLPMSQHSLRFCVTLFLSVIFIFTRCCVCSMCKSFLQWTPHTHTHVSWGVKKQHLSHLKVQHFYQSTAPFWPLDSFNCTWPCLIDTFVPAFICHYVSLFLHQQLLT